MLLVAACSDPAHPAEQKRESRPDIGWPHHGQDLGEARYSQLADINARNVGRLGVAWTYELATTMGVEATPLVEDGVMYVTGPWSVVHAIDARNGKHLWTFDPRVQRQWARWGCCGPVNRGVALWNDRVFVGTFDGRLIAIRKAGGSMLWEVQTTPDGPPYTITGAPRVADGRVIIGNAGAEFGVRGYLTAYDGEDGRELWRFYTVPGDPSLPLEHPDLAVALPTWTGEWWKFGGGGTAWDSIAYDPALGLLYVGTGNGSPWPHWLRSPGGGDNLFLSSILALQVETGRLAWHYQTTPGESWDYTAAQHMVLTDLYWKGEQRKVLLQAPKNGFLYVLDRISGELLSAKPYVAVNWTSGVDLETGRPIETGDGDYSDAMKRVMPGPLGGHNWQPMSFSQRTGLLYFPAQETALEYRSAEAFSHDSRTANQGLEFDQRVIEAMLENPPVIKGHLLAWDPVREAVAWSRPQEGPWHGGVLSSAGGLVFQGTADGMLTAYRDTDGEVLWQLESGTGFSAPPITYRLDGEQYVAIAAGVAGAGFSGPLQGAKINDFVNHTRVIALKLDGEGVLPPPEERGRALPAMPAIEIDAARLESGEAMYGKFCAACHGTAVVSGMLYPDLRYLSPQKHGLFKEIVLDGALVERGMPRFDDVVDPAQAKALQMYILSQAKALRDRASAARQ
ncbi:PQQ-dependent dehydrogenase, methanol/ethanol family [Pseudohaliea sp.]|uniref:PQQ-dependent dehydrogenase, methanol/ethanol family n=1 Tax=Pseudohaliea sp. TaxID=2740289 RepID=UPI0032ED7C0B